MLHHASSVEGAMYPHGGRRLSDYLDRGYAPSLHVCVRRRGEQGLPFLKLPTGVAVSRDVLPARATAATMAHSAAAHAKPMTQGALQAGAEDKREGRETHVHEHRHQHTAGTLVDPPISILKATSDLTRIPRSHTAKTARELSSR